MTYVFIILRKENGFFRTNFWRDILLVHGRPIPAIFLERHGRIGRYFWNLDIPEATHPLPDVSPPQLRLLNVLGQVRYRRQQLQLGILLHLPLGRDPREQQPHEQLALLAVSRQLGHLGQHAERLFSNQLDLLWLGGGGRRLLRLGLRVGPLRLGLDVLAKKGSAKSAQDRRDVRDEDLCSVVEVTWRQKNGTRRYKTLDITGVYPFEVNGLIHEITLKLPCGCLWQFQTTIVWLL